MRHWVAPAQIREILQADEVSRQASGAEALQGEQQLPSAPGQEAMQRNGTTTPSQQARPSSNGGKDSSFTVASDGRPEWGPGEPDQARRASSDSWASAGSQLDVDTGSEEGSSLGASPVSSAALAKEEPREAEVVPEQSSYRPIMWCARRPGRACPPLSTCWQVEKGISG